jgi:hypothetical protein
LDFWHRLILALVNQVHLELKVSVPQVSRALGSTVPAEQEESKQKEQGLIAKATEI